MLVIVPLPKGRLEALTDGIFAVSMTLIVLDLKFPSRAEVDAKGLWEVLLEMGPKLDDYVISFVVLCVFWLSHLRLFTRIREVDGIFIAFNLAFLLFTTFVPPLTTLLDEHATHPRAAITYGANLLAIVGSEALLWRHAMKKLANESVLDAGAVWHFVRGRYLFGIGVVVAGIVVALAELELGIQSSYATYVYLFLLGAGLVRRPAPKELMQPGGGKR
jgi:uncharacterized membrane protein